MTREPRPNADRYTFNDEELAWMAEHAMEVETRFAGPHFLYVSLVVALLLGLATHISGYVLRSLALSEPAGLGAELLYAVGWALWTGVVVFVFAEVIPEAKRRQVSRYLGDYEAAKRDRARGARAPDVAGRQRPTTGPRPD
jgi:hypothetical protein